MPKIPLSSPATGKPTNSSFIHTTACNFVDNAGRTLLLRGVNLSGSSKAPVDRPSYILRDFWESAEAGGESFIGQPLNIDDGSADVHLTRLKGWGFNLLRFPVTWEALEHAGPGKYDYEFMDYTVRVLQKCKAYGFKVYIDPHQDVWSRFSGGSGAPFWTLAACGINPRNLTATQSAVIHCEYPLSHSPDPATLPAMMWSTNYGRLLSQTVYTLFFAGRDFAPRCIIDGKNIQDYLQEHYIEAFGQLADRIRDIDGGGLLDECVIGWDPLNEPFEGLCAWENLSVNPSKQGSTLKKGTHPTPAQGLRLGMGQAQTVENYTFGSLGPSRVGTVTIDPKGLTIWADRSMESPEGVHPTWGWKRDVRKWPLGTCVWANHGVWDIQTGFMLQDDYFKYSPETGLPVDFIEEYWKPHFIAYAKRIRASHPEAILFVQPPVFAKPPEIGEEVLKGRCVYSPHYYDGLTLVTRHWNWFNADALGLLRGMYASSLQAVKIGTAAIRKSLQEQLGMLKGDAQILKGSGYPTVIGEIGTPFDMDGKRSYGWTDGGRHKGDYGRQENALDASLNGADGGNNLNWTVWTYCASHTHDWGDGWNMEDLSIWSADDLREKEWRGQGTRGDDEEEEEGLYDSTVGESSAGLLRKEKQDTSVVTIAAASALSLVTLGSTNPAGSVKHMTIRTGGEHGDVKSLHDWFEDPFDFLTDGARAVRAFCRPWPHKIIGVPLDIKFEIGKAYFELVVSVSEEDGLALGGQDDEKERLATEIYIPLVHYAEEDLVRKGDSGEKKGGRRGSADEQKGTAATGGRNSAPNSPARSRRTSSVDLTRVGRLSPNVDDLKVIPRDLVDVDVKVSAGRWEVKGQMLKWWYDVPKVGEGKREYRIEVRRRTGVIKPLESGKTVGNWCERFCGCDIM